MTTSDIWKDMVVNLEKIRTMKELKKIKLLSEQKMLQVFSKLEAKEFAQNVFHSH